MLRAALSFFTCLVVANATVRAQDSSPAPLYHLTATWTLPGDGPCAALAVDPGARRLYAVRPDRVQVLDADGGQPVGELPGLDGAHALALAPRLGRGFVTNSHANTLITFDLKTLAAIGEPIPVAAAPEAVVYVPGRDKLFVFDSVGSDLTVLDANTYKPLGTVTLGGRPGSAVAEGGGRVFVSLPDKNEVVGIDAETLAVENHYPLKTGKAPAGLSLDPDGGRLFIACANELIVVMATEDGTIMSTPTVGQGADGTAFDMRAKLALAANGADGTLTVIDAYKASPRAVGTIPTRPGARSLAVDQKTHAVYVAAANTILRYDYDGTRGQKPAR